LARLGSTARDTATSGSDVDVPVAFDGPATSRRYFGVQFYLDDMIDFAGKVLVYTDGLGLAGFVANGLPYDAALRNLELIGEAAAHIPDEVSRRPL
jgi:hypothetical protein